MIIVSVISLKSLQLLDKEIYHSISHKFKVKNEKVNLNYPNF